MFARACSILVVALGVLSLSRWFFGVPQFQFGANWTNGTGPNAGLFLVILGLCGVHFAWRRPEIARLDTGRWRGPGRTVWVVLPMLCIAGGLYRIAEVTFGIDMGFDSTIRRLPHYAEASFPQARNASTMSFPTSMCILIAGSAALLMQIGMFSHRLRTLAGWLGSSCAAVGGIFAMGHIYGQPLTYGGRPVAMAANTAVGFITVGVGYAMLVSGHERWARHRLISTLRRARESLEIRVRERTSALSAAIEALRVETDERRKSEASLVHAQKMESIGRLAAGIAHDFNNLLMVIRSSAEYIEQQRVPAAAMELLKQIRDAAVSGGVLTSRLLKFGKRSKAAERTDLPPAPIVSDVLSLVRPMLGSRIRATLDASPELWTIRADAGEIEQVLVNLCINAKDAMPQGGTLTVRAVNAALPEPVSAVPEVVPPGDYVLVEVKDTGIGMSREVIQHAFEPFFTTKPEGQGSGLGLATSYGIVRQHGGHITVQSTPGQGTEFRVYLPRAESKRGVDAA